MATELLLILFKKVKVLSGNACISAIAFDQRKRNADSSKNKGIIFLHSSLKNLPSFSKIQRQIFTFQRLKKQKSCEPNQATLNLYFCRNVIHCELHIPFETLAKNIYESVDC